MKPYGLRALLCAALLPNPLVEAQVLDDSDQISWQASHIFKTEPKFDPPIVKVELKTNDTSLLAPGYIFFDPRGDEIRRPGPQIVDMDGNLVLWATSLMNKHAGRAQNVHVCDFLGEKGKHMCWTDVGITKGGVNRIFDNTYKQVGNGDYDIAGHFKHPNPHEFHTIDDGRRFVQAVYSAEDADLRPYGSAKKGHVTNGCFQEVDVGTGVELFRWCAMDHFELWQTRIFLAVKKNLSGTGNRTMKSAGNGWMTAWDWMHLNSVDKNFEGDYLVSARHFDQLIKVAGIDAKKVHGVKPGTVLWKLGGPEATFKMDEEVNFGLQHHARFISTNKTHTLVSVFNNGGAPTTPDGAPSDCRIIAMNNVTNEAVLVKKYVNEGVRRSVAQGSCNILDNGNAFVGWGKNPMYSEFTQDGTRIYHAYFGAIKSYRAYKFPWVGHPPWKPKVLVYAQNCRYSPLVAYVSWNGATEVRWWRFQISTESKTGPWMPVGTWAKDGFETKAILGEKEGLVRKLTQFVPYVKVEALDARRQVLETVVAETWVPRRDGKKAKGLKCDRESCFLPKRFEYRVKYSKAGRCKASEVPHWLAIVMVVAFFETCNFVWQRIWLMLVRYEKRRVRLR